MPNRPKTPVRGIRVPDEEWLPFQEATRERGETMTDVIRAAIRRYNNKRDSGPRVNEGPSG